MTGRRASHGPSKRCPACGTLVTRQHAVHLHGEVFHAHCVLYRQADSARSRGKEQAESR